jgi:hypothetical protein
MLFVSLFLFTTLTFSQNVGIKADGTAPDNSAMLEVGSTEKGFLMPRMTTDEIAAITSPANGLMVYCTTDGKFYIYNSLIVAWKEIKYGSGIIATNCGKVLDGAKSYLPAIGERGRQAFFHYIMPHRLAFSNRCRTNHADNLLGKQ